MEESVALTCFPPYDELASSENCIFRERMYGACSEEEVNRRRAEARARGDKGCGD